MRGAYHLAFILVSNIFTTKVASNTKLKRVINTITVYIDFKNGQKRMIIAHAVYDRNLA
jgi:hypothetical protein